MPLEWLGPLYEILLISGICTHVMYAILMYVLIPGLEPGIYLDNSGDKRTKP